MKKINITFNDGISIIKYISNLYKEINLLNRKLEKQRHFYIKELERKQRIIDNLTELIER